MDTTLYPRFSQKSVDTVLADTPVAVIQGARQVGKSTLAQQVASVRDSIVVTLDDPDTLALAKADPVSFLDRAPDSLMVIDEAQRAPELILPLKATIDRDRRPGRFLLTGSADLFKTKGVGDSLAGRAENIDMYPLSQGELARRNTPEDFVAWIKSGIDVRESKYEPLKTEAVIRGGYPEPGRRSWERSRSWFISYIVRLADHDARELNQGGYADQFSALLSILAAQGQSELVKAKVARTLSISETTASSYVRLAKEMRLIVEIPAWGRAPRSRVTRRQKVCLTDTGLAASLAGFTMSQASAPGGREYFGSLVEQFVTLELAKQRAWSTTPFGLHHYRERDGLEVDLVVETADGQVIAIEVKSTRTITPKLWESLSVFRDRFPDREVTGVLLHAGDSAATLHDWLHVLPISAVWQH